MLGVFLFFSLWTHSCGGMVYLALYNLGRVSNITCNVGLPHPEKCVLNLPLRWGMYYADAQGVSFFVRPIENSDSEDNLTTF